MSLNQTAPVGAAGLGGIIVGQYEPASVPVESKTSKLATAPALTRGQVITIDKTGATRGQIRVATYPDFGPFGMVYKDKALNETRVEFISQRGVIVYLKSDGAIKPGMPVKPSPTTPGEVVEAVLSGTAPDDVDEIVGIYISKGIEVAKSNSGTEVPSDAADGDIIRVRLAGTNGDLL